MFSGIATSFLKCFAVSVKTYEEFDNFKEAFTYIAFVMAAAHLII